ncbi:hypothetical protein D3C87_1823100 [compost metagenome]
MRASATAVTAMTAGDVAFAGNAIANFEAFHFLANANHFTDIFVAHNHWHGNGFL